MKQPKEYPESWQLVELGELSSLITKGTTPTTNGFEYLQQGVNFVKVESISSNGSLIPAMFAHVGIDCHNSFKRSQLSEGDILFTIAGALGRSTIVRKEILPANTNQAVAIIRLKNQESTNFIYHFLRGNEIDKLIGRINVSTAQANLSLGQINKFSIPLPPLPEQQKIAEILSTVDEKIDLIDQKIKETEELKKGMMQRLLTKGIGHTKFKDSPLGKIPIDWTIFKLSDIIDLIHGYQFRTNDFTEKGIAVIKISNVIGSELYTDELTYIDLNRYDEFSKYEILEGDILMSLTGNIGRVVEVGELKQTFLQNYRVGKFTPVNNNQLHNRYIKYLLSSPLILSQFYKFSNQSAQANFGKQDMDKVWVTIPTQLTEQKKISIILSTVDEKLAVLFENKVNYQELKQGLMQKLLTGKIRVNNLIKSEVTA